MDVSCIPESGCCCLFVPLFFPFSLCNFQTLKIFVTLFSGTVRPRRFKLYTNVDNEWMYCVYRNQAAAMYLSLYLFIFLSLQFSSIKNFCHTFLRNCEAYKVETWYTREQWMDLSCIPKVFITFFSRTARHKKLKLYKHEE